MALRIFPLPLSMNPRYTDDFGAPRANGRTHKGNDLFAPLGTPIMAPDDGYVSFYTDGVGGPSFTLKCSDGSRFYGTHLSGYAFGVDLGSDTRSAPRFVRAGTVIGYVGIGGNAVGTPPHLHLQYWLPSGELVDPYSYLRAAQGLQAPPSPSIEPLAKSASADEMLSLALALGGAAFGLAYLYRRSKRRR